MSKKRNQLSDTIMVNVGRTYVPGMKATEVLQIAQGDWRTRIDRAQHCRTLVAVAKGAVVGEFRVHGASEVPGTNRVRFDLGVARRKHWTGKDVRSYYPRGAANAIRYV